MASLCRGVSSPRASAGVLCGKSRVSEGAFCAISVGVTRGTWVIIGPKMHSVSSGSMCLGWMARAVEQGVFSASKHVSN